MESLIKIVQMEQLIIVVYYWDMRTMIGLYKLH